MGKYIREGRFGPPKCYKTGSVVSSYPKPMLVLNFDEGGLDIIKTPVTYVDPAKLKEMCSIKDPKELPEITCVDFCDVSKKQITLIYTPAPAPIPFQTFVDTVNNLVLVGCPWKTIVVDSLTGLNEAILTHIAQASPGSLADPRKWGGMTGGKVAQCLSVLTSINSHCVFIAHCTIEKLEMTSEVLIQPLINGRFRDRVGALLSQFFFQTYNGKEVVLYTKPQGFVKGVGARWPADLPPECKPLFADIYGKSTEIQN